MKLKKDLDETGLTQMLDTLQNDDATSSEVTRGLRALKHAVKGMQLMVPIGKLARVNGQYKYKGKFYAFIWSEKILEPDDPRIGSPMTHEEVQKVLEAWTDLENGLRIGDDAF